MTDTLPSALATGGVGAVDGFGLPAGMRMCLEVVGFFFFFIIHFPEYF